jgi:hypothetical protein
MRQRYSPRKARIVREENGLTLIQFIPGGHYWLTADGRLLTGVNKQPASGLVRAKLTALAKRATKDWTV